MAWYLAAGRIAHVWYPAFPPDKNGRDGAGVAADAPMT
jgi:hypothetical protein